MEEKLRNDTSLEIRLRVERANARMGNPAAATTAAADEEAAPDPPALHPVLSVPTFAWAIRQQLLQQQPMQQHQRHQWCSQQRSQWARK